jgi:hypothetical protein
LVEFGSSDVLFEKPLVLWGLAITCLHHLPNNLFKVLNARANERMKRKPATK